MTWRSLCAIGVLTLIGCGEKVPFGVAPVRGKVTYDDGSTIPAHRITISFISQTPAKGKEHPRPGNATLNADGTFTNVTTWNPLDGAIPGKHKLVIQAFDDKDAPSPAIPEIYADVTKTPVEIDVPAGGGELPPIKVAKPK